MQEKKSFVDRNARLNGLAEGDQNPGFLLQRKERIQSLKNLSGQGTSLMHDDDIEVEFISFYKRLYTKKDGIRYLPSSLNWDPISSSHNLALEAPLKEEEVWHVIQEVVQTNLLDQTDSLLNSSKSLETSLIEPYLLEVFKDFFRMPL